MACERTGVIGSGVCMYVCEMSCRCEWMSKLIKTDFAITTYIVLCNKEVKINASEVLKFKLVGKCNTLTKVYWKNTLVRIPAYEWF